MDRLFPRRFRAAQPRRLALSLALTSLALSTLVSLPAAGVNFSWSNHMFGSVNLGGANIGCGRAATSAKAVVKDAAGNLYVTGCASNGTNDDILTYKIDAATGLPAWKASFSGNGDGADAGHAIAIDASGNVVVTGFSTEAGGAKNVRTIKYNGTTGAQMWNASYGDASPGDDIGYGIAIDGSGNVFVVGSTTVAGQDGNIMTLKYAGDTGALQWDRNFDGTDNAGAGGHDVGEAVALDASGNVYVTGKSFDTAGGNNFRTIKYNTGGTQQWNVAANGAGNADDGARTMAINGSGELFVGGYSTGSDATQNMRLIKYNTADGTVGWSADYAGTAAGADGILAMTFDSSGHPVVTGFSVENPIGQVMRTIKYDRANGNVLWNFQGVGGAGQSVSLDSLNAVYVLGYSTSSLRLTRLNADGSQAYSTVVTGFVGAADCGTSVHAVAPSFVVLAACASESSGARSINAVKLDGPTAGTYWAGKHPHVLGRGGVAAAFAARAVAVDSSGHVYATGYSQQGTAKKFTTVKYHADTGAVVWVRVNPGMTGDGEGLAIAVRSGIAHVAGYCGRDFGTEICVSQLDAGTGTPASNWTHSSGISESKGLALAVDDAGDTYVAGYVTQASGGRDLTVLRFRQGFGTAQGIYSFNGAASAADEAAAVAVQSGAVYVTGYSTDASGGENIRTVKLNAELTVAQWNSAYAGTAGGSDRGTSIAVDAGGNVFVGGRSQETGTSGTYRTIKYNAAGAQQWTAGDGGPTASQGVRALTLDGSGNVFVTGAGAHPSGGQTNIGTIKYNGATGAELWRSSIDGGSSGDDAGNSIARVSNGHVVVAGSSMDGVLSVRLVKYDGANGAQLQSFALTGGAGSSAAGYGVAVGPNNEIAVVGNARMPGYPEASITAKFSNPDVPDAPTLTAATAGDASIQVFFVAPANTGGSAILDYTATCGTQSATGTSSPITVTGLANGSSYTCTVVARTANGNSASSTVSASVTPTVTSYSLNVSKTGQAIGTITSSPAGIDCGGDCQQDYARDTVVTLTATTGPLGFVSWSGATCSQGNNGKVCTFTMNAPRTVVATFGETPANTRQSDFNGDGRSDILWHNSATGMVYELQMNGLTAGTGAVIDQETDLNWKIAAVADLNGDGRADVVWQHDTTGQVYGLLMNGTTASGEGTIYTEPNTNWKIVGAGDFNGDSRADLLWKNNATGDVFLLMLNGLSVVSGGVIYSEPNTAWQIQKVADFNSDGRADVLWRNTATGDVYMMLMNGTTVTGGGVIYSEPNTAWQIQAAADFNGDGRADVLWRNTTTGDVYMMLMNGTTITGGSVFYGEPNADWKIVATGDYNGDGRADILWRNTATGQVFMMLMNGVTISSGGFVYTEPDQNWKILGP